MSNSFDDLFGGASLLLLEHFGDALVYAPPLGDPIGLTASVAEERTEEVTNDRGTHWVRTREAALPRTTEAAGGGPCVACPSLRATVAIGTVIYAVAAIVAQSEHWTILRLERPEVVERTTPEYRRP